MGVLLCGNSGHGRLHLGLRAFHTLLVNTLPDPRKCIFNSGARWGGGGGGSGAWKLSHALQIITRRFNHPHSAISMNT